MYRSWLASCDTDGTIIVWDVSSCIKVTSFSENSNRPVLTIDWLDSLQSATRDLLVAVHPSYSLVMWNAATGNKLWKKTYTSELYSFSLDPFDASRILLLCNEGVLFVTDFMISQAPSSDGKKIPLPANMRYTKSPSNLSLSSESNIVSSTSVMLSTTRSFSKQFTNVMNATGMKSGGDISGNDSHGNQLPVSEDAILHVEFLPTMRDHFIVVNAHKISIINLKLEVAIHNIVLDTTISPFIQVCVSKQRDMFYCLHSNGSVTCRVLRPVYSEACCKKYGLNYDVRVQTDSIRLASCRCLIRSGMRDKTADFRVGQNRRF